MKTKSTLIELLLKQSEMYLRDLPETIRIPALDGNRADEVVRPLEARASGGRSGSMACSRASMSSSIRRR